jgi:hypothetical protein
MLQNEVDDEVDDVLQIVEDDEVEDDEVLLLYVETELLNEMNSVIILQYLVLVHVNINGIQLLLIEI